MPQAEDEAWMRKAIEIARSKGSDPSTSPLGCVIVLDGKIIAGERNQTEELPDVRGDNYDGRLSGDYDGR